MEKMKRKDGFRYRETIILNGKKINGPSFRRKSDAKAWKQTKLLEIENLKAQGIDYFNQRQDSQILKEFAKNWLEDIVAVKRTKRTYDNYRSNLNNHILPLLGEVQLSDITMQDGNRLMRRLKDRGHNAKGINLIMGVLKTLLYEAKRQSLILKNPLEDLESLPKELQDYRFFSKVELEDFLEATKNEKLFPLYFCAFMTGMRKGELAALKWDRVCLHTNRIEVTRTIDRYGLRDSTKSKRKRVVPIHPELRRLLIGLYNDEHRSNKPSSYVFAMDNEGLEPAPYQHLYRDFKKAQKKAGITETMKFHGTRHTFASHYVMQGGSIFDLQKILGHSSVEMTEIYSHHTPEHLQSSVQFMGIGTKLDEKYPESTQTLRLVAN